LLYTSATVDVFYRSSKRLVVLFYTSAHETKRLQGTKRRTTTAEASEYIKVSFWDYFRNNV
jgi:hypothetical protein